MHHPQFDGISRIHNQETFFSSRYTSAQSTDRNNEQNFHSVRTFVYGTLQSWGMKPGHLSFSKDNQQTLKCISQLINQKQKDMALKAKLKEDVLSVQFQKEKYQSLLKQSKIQIQEKDRYIGKIQNQCIQIRNKLKKLQAATKKQKSEDLKIINLLKSKNQQVMHEMKKRQAQVTRVKQQMKKSVIDKSTTSKSSNGKQPIAINTFQKIANLQSFQSFKIKSKSKGPPKTNINVKCLQEQKFAFMIESHQKQKKYYQSQNIMLRQKIYQVRQILLQFAQWTDLQIFGLQIQQIKRLKQKKFIVNHNLLFSKNTLIEDLQQVVQEAKNGIIQFQTKLQKYQFNESGCNSPSKSKKQINRRIKMQEIVTQKDIFKKKSTSIRTQSINLQARPLGCNIQGNKIRSQKMVNAKLAAQKTEIKKNKINQQQHFKRQNFQLSAFENDLLSDVYEKQDIDNSIVSHVDVEQLLNKGKYDKWDILFRADQDD